MKIDLSNGQNKLQFFQELYNNAEAAASNLQADLKKWLEQYRGSPKIDSIDPDNPAKDATEVRNITYELIESQVTSYIPSPVVTPVTKSEANEACAKSIESLLRNKRDEQPFEELNDMDERFNPIYGGSVWFIEWDNSIRTHNTVGDAKVSCLSPTHFVGQPSIYKIEDMEYLFVDFETTTEDIVRRYGVTPQVAEEAESDEHTTADDNTATIHICFYKNEDEEICQYIWSAETELLDEENYYARKYRVCEKCGKREEVCKCAKPKWKLVDEEYEELESDVILSDGSVLPSMCDEYRDGKLVTEQVSAPILDPISGAPILDKLGLPEYETIDVPKKTQTKIPWYRPKTFPIVIRKNTSLEDSVLGQSDCFFIRPQQQAINKLESRIMEKLMGSAVYPLVPEGSRVELDNSVWKKVFKVKPQDRGAYGTLDLQTSIQQDIQASERLYDQAKRILGISDSFQGQRDTSAQSGYAKQLQIQQSQGRLQSKHEMKNFAYSMIDRILFELYLAYADEPRNATYMDEEGVIQNVEFNRYDFVRRDETGEFYYDDEYMFAADSNNDVTNRVYLWQENRNNFQTGAYGNPQLLETQLIFWLNMKRAHYPFADDNVQRIRNLIKKQAEIAQIQEQNAQMANELQMRQGYEDSLLNKLGTAYGADMTQFEGGKV